MSQHYHWLDNYEEFSKEILEENSPGKFERLFIKAPIGWAILGVTPYSRIARDLIQEYLRWDADQRELEAWEVMDGDIAKGQRASASVSRFTLTDIEAWLFAIEDITIGNGIFMDEHPSALWLEKSSKCKDDLEKIKTELTIWKEDLKAKGAISAWDEIFC